VGQEKTIHQMFGFDYLPAKASEKRGDCYMAWQEFF